jgi:putative aldouronate transport system substrate-binding protein
MFVGDSLSRIIEAEGVIAVEDELPKYENLWTTLDNGNLLKWTAAPDGHTYSIPIHVQVETPQTTLQPNFESPIGFFLQKHVLADAGYPAPPKTVDEYFSMIEAYVEKYPEIDGAKTIGFEMLNDDWRNWPLRGPVGSLMGFGNQGEVYVDNETLKVSSYHIGQEAYDFYKRVNQAFHKGVIDPETFTMSHDEYLARISSGAVLGFFDQTWNFGQGRDVLVADGKIERTYVAMPLAIPGVTDNYNDMPTGRPDAVNGIALSVNNDKVDRTLAYFNWMAQREIQDWIRWGEEGKDWVYVDGDKGKAFTPERRAVWADTTRRRDETGFVLADIGPRPNGIYKSDGEATDSNFSVYEYNEKMLPFDKEFFEKYDAMTPADLLSPPTPNPQYYPIWNAIWEEDPAVAMTKNQINDICVKWYPRIIMSANDSEFDSNWEAFVAEYEALDLDYYFKWIEEEIATRMAK